MLNYTYTAHNPSTGRKVSSDLQADSESAAVKLIQAEGLVPIDIKLDSKKAGGGRFSRVASKDRVLFSRQLSTLINAGLPLVQSLNNVNLQTTNKMLRGVTSKVIADVEGGTTLSVSMSRHPKVFNKVYVSMVAAGEVSGTLDKSLERLADQQEKDADIVIKREDTIKAVDVQTREESTKSHDLYTELIRLDELRKKGILTEDELPRIFQTIFK